MPRPTKLPAVTSKKFGKYFISGEGKGFSSSKQSVDEHFESRVLDRLLVERGESRIKRALQIGPRDRLGQHCGGRERIGGVAQVPGGGTRLDVTFEAQKEFPAKTQNE